MELDAKDRIILESFLDNPGLTIGDLLRDRDYDLSYSALQKRVKRLRALGLLHQGYQLSSDAMSALYPTHFLLGIVIDLKALYGDRGTTLKGLIRAIMAVLEHEFGKSVFVEDAIIVTGSEAEIILKVYTSAETLDVIESVRKVVGVGGTVTYNVIGEVVLRKSLLGGV